MSTYNSDNSRRFTLTPNYAVLILSLLFLPLLLILGFWQLDRAEEKSALLREFNMRLNKTPVALTSVDRLDNYTQVVMTGHFINNKQWLLDNRVRGGRVGYEVITPFQISADKIVLINRGWVEAPKFRDDLPDVSVGEQAVTVHASAYKPLLNSLIAAHRNSGQWPIVINAIDLSSMGKEFGRPLSQNYFRIDKHSPEALVTDWRIINTQPEKHTAYAVQWFAMAFALLLLTLTANSNIILWLKKVSSEDVNDEY